MAVELIATDNGNGAVKSIRKMKRGSKTTIFPSVRAQVTGDTLGKDIAMQMDYQYGTWDNKKFTWGDSVFAVNRQAAHRLQGQHRYGDEHHQFLTAIATAMLGVKRGNVDLSLFIPPGMYKKMRDKMLEMYSADDGTVRLHLNGESKERKWKYSRIRVFPEGLAAAACFTMDEDGKTLKTDVLDGTVLILDIGMYTLDSILMVGGNFNPETLAIATNKKLGIRKTILDPIVRYLQTHHGSDMNVIMADDIDRCLRNGLSGDKYTLRSGMTEIASSDMHMLIDDHAQTLAQRVADGIIERDFESLDGIKSCILVGGGATLVAPFLRKIYPEKIKQAKDFPQTKDIPPVMLNAAGGIRLAQAQIRAGR